MDELTPGAILATKRKDLRMTQDHLAAAACVSRSTIQRAERGLPVSHENVRSICAVLGIEPATVAIPTRELPTEPDAAEASRPFVTHAQWVGAGSLFLAVSLSFLSVVVLGPNVQRLLGETGKGSPWVQAWAETMLPYCLALMVLALPFALLADERRFRRTGDVRWLAFNTTANMMTVVSGVMLFSSIFLPVIIASSRT